MESSLENLTRPRFPLPSSSQTASQSLLGLPGFFAAAEPWIFQGTSQAQRGRVSGRGEVWGWKPLGSGKPPYFILFFVISEPGQACKPEVTQSSSLLHGSHRGAYAHPIPRDRPPGSPGWQGCHLPWAAPGASGMEVSSATCKIRDQGPEGSCDIEECAP